MNEQEIIEGNKLIAEFVDLEVLANPHLGGVRPKSSNSTPVDLLKIIYCEIGYGQESVYPQFNSSWDWIMPVVAKIQKLYETKREFGGIIEITTTHIRISIKSFYYCVDKTSDNWTPFDIKTLFKVVVEFIKWYNTN